MTMAWFILGFSILIGGCFALAFADDDAIIVRHVTFRMAFFSSSVALLVGLFAPSVLDSIVGGRHSGDGWPLILLAPLLGAIVGLGVGRIALSNLLAELEAEKPNEEPEPAPKTDTPKPFDVPPQSP